MVSCWRQVVLALVLLMPLVGRAGEEPIAVVVNDQTATSELSFEELQRIYLGKTTFFRDRKKITPAVNAHLEQRFYRLVLGLTTRQVRKHWMKLVFSGADVIPPIGCSDPDEVRNLLQKKESVICFVRLSAVDSCMKVLTIDGKRPGDADYPLK